nr:MAG TPA: hypothetical protein [Caudoviricetes sp.]
MAHPFCPTIFKLNNIFTMTSHVLYRAKYGRMQCAL